MVLAYSIMHDHWKFWKVCAWWLPRELKDQGETVNRMGLSLQCLLRYADEGEDTLNRIVTDESWVHHYQSKSKRASVQTSQFTFNPRFEVTPSAGKVMLTMFSISQRVLLAHFQNHGENVNSASAS
jgi:hypothetical protein